MQDVIQAEQVFDGHVLHPRAAVVVADGRVVSLAPADPARPLLPGVLMPGFVDVQVNGGGGALLGRGDPVADLRAICAAQGALGTLALFPTLITTTPAATRAVIDAALAMGADTPGFAGLHLEGPHLDPARAGAHDPALIRPMTAEDLALYLHVARHQRLILTVAPEGATPAQIGALTGAGVRVCLGHSDAAEGAVRAVLDAGAQGFTHLYNAMSPLSHRAPGMVGVALDGAAWAGIIADGVHVSAAAFRVALNALGDRLFVVTDAMAPAGTSADSFTLDGREIRRSGGRLMLADGTLAGADITMAQSVAWMVGQAGVGLAQALAMVTHAPAQFAGLREHGHLHPGARADMVLLDDSLSLTHVWRAGVAL